MAVCGYCFICGWKFSCEDEDEAVRWDCSSCTTPRDAFAGAAAERSPVDHAVCIFCHDVIVDNEANAAIDALVVEIKHLSEQLRAARDRS